MCFEAQADDPRQQRRWTVCVTMVLSITNPFMEVQLLLGTVTSCNHEFLPEIMSCSGGKETCLLLVFFCQSLGSVANTAGN